MRRTRIIGLAAGRHRARALVTGLGDPAVVQLVVLAEEGRNKGALLQTQTIERWHRTPTKSRPGSSDMLCWAKPT
ncbi:MAG: hypothetical protein ACR2QK_07755, partial [Acidimicrobiales bacterium]